MLAKVNIVIDSFISFIINTCLMFDGDLEDDAIDWKS